MKPTIRVKLISNSGWLSIAAKATQIKKFFEPICYLEIDLEITNFHNVPYTKQLSLGRDNKTFWATVIESFWYDRNISFRATGYDAVLFQVEGNPDPGMSGARRDNDEGAIELEVYSNEHDHAYQKGVDIGNAFVHWTSHEILHALFMLTDEMDTVHQRDYFDNNLSLCFKDLHLEKFTREKKISALWRAIAFLQSLIKSLMPEASQPEPSPTPEPVKKSRIEEWAKAISVEEGFYPGSRAYKNNNPGNIKYAPLIKELGATSRDKDNFAVFPDFNTGMNALCEFLKLAAEDKLKHYHNARTLLKFTNVYALPPENHPYAANIAKKLGVSVDINIRELL